MRWISFMKIFISLSVILLIGGCHSKTEQNSATALDSSENPQGHKSYLDTGTYNKGQLYGQDSIRHPLIQFGLSYSEWKTISCIIAVDEDAYWDKYMIGLIEKTGELRIHYKGQKIYLSPSRPVKMNEGKWLGTFKNDSLEIDITGQLENKRILRHLTGYGNLVLRAPKQTINETIYLVYENE